MPDKKRTGGAPAGRSLTANRLPSKQSNQELDQLPQLAKASAGRTTEEQLAEIEKALTIKRDEGEDLPRNAKAKHAESNQEPRLHRLLESHHQSIEELDNRIRNLSSRLESVLRIVPEEGCDKASHSLSCGMLPQALSSIAYATERVERLISAIDDTLSRLEV